MATLKKKKNTKAERSSDLWCSDCGYKRHSKNHEEGIHHKYGKGKVPVKR